MVWKKIWLIIKNYWYLPVLLALLIVVFWNKIRRDQILEVIADMIKNHASEVKILETARNVELKKQQELDAKYKKAIAELEQSYEVKVAELAKKKQNLIKEYVESYQGDPNAMASEMAKEFGFKLGVP